MILKLVSKNSRSILKILSVFRFTIPAGIPAGTYVSQAISVLLNIGIIDYPLRLIYNRTGVLIGMVHILLPFLILPLYSVLTRIDESYTSAASSLGASPVKNFLRVYLPLSLPGIASGAVLVFVMGLGY